MDGSGAAFPLASSEPNTSTPRFEAAAGRVFLHMDSGSARGDELWVVDR